MPQRRTFAPMPMNNPAPTRTGRGASPAGVVGPPSPQPLPPAPPTPQMGGAAGPTSLSPMLPAGGASGPGGAGLPAGMQQPRLPSSIPLSPATPAPGQSGAQPIGTSTVNPFTIDNFLTTQAGSTMGSTMIPQTGMSDPMADQDQTSGESDLPLALIRMMGALRG